MIKGKIQFVLPRFMLTPYINIGNGCEFGVADIVGSCKCINVPVERWVTNKINLTRQFTVMARSHSEVLSFDLDNLEKMRREFAQAYESLM